MILLQHKTFCGLSSVMPRRNQNGWNRKVFQQSTSLSAPEIRAKAIVCETQASSVHSKPAYGVAFSLKLYNTKLHSRNRTTCPDSEDPDRELWRRLSALRRAAREVPFRRNVHHI